MTYTEDQEIALEGLLKWYKMPQTKEPNDISYLVDGAAGTGKTTIVKQAINILGLRNNGLAVTAPTHQAKKVIQAATDFQAITTQKLLGLRPNVSLDDFDISNPQFDPLSEEQIKYYKIVIIDEASMINKDAFDLLTERAAHYGTRIIYLGDSFQLPPINEKISKVFTNIFHNSTLRTIVRQGDGNPNTDLLLALRDDIQNETDVNLNKYLKMENQMKDIKGFKLQNNVDFAKDLLAFYNSTLYEHDFNHARYLAWTNNSVVKWSEGLRKQVLKEQAEKQLVEGEKLIGYSTISDYRTGDIYLQNSDVYEVVKIEEGESSFGITGFFVTIEDGDGQQYLHFVVNRQDKKAFTELAYEKWSAARNAHYRERGKKWAMFFGFKDRHLVMEDVYYKGMPIKKDLYYAYGSTVHKSQGSTFGNTAVNLRDINRNRTPNERRRLAYVALSRCQNTNLILSK